MDKNLGNEDVDDPYYLSVEFDIRNMWKIQYYGNGLYTLHSMAQLDMALTTQTSGSDTYAVIPNSRHFDRVMFWTIELDKNGYYLQQYGKDSATLYAPNPNRSTHPYLLT